MKKFILILSLFCTSLLYASDLSIYDLQRIFAAGNWNNANQILSKKNWYYYSSEDNTDYEGYKITWSYKNKTYASKAEGWLIGYIANRNEDKLSLLSYQMITIEEYNQFMSQLSKAGYTFVRNTKNNAGETEYLKSYYQSGKYVLELVISKYPDDGDEENYHGYWGAVLYEQGGIYDSYNGKKTAYYRGEDDEADKQHKLRECTLRDGKIINEYKAYAYDGHLVFVLKPQNNAWIYEEYNDQGEEIGKLTFTLKNQENLDSYCNYTINASGFYRWEEPINSDEGNIKTYVKGEIPMAVIGTGSSYHCPLIYVHVLKENQNFEEKETVITFHDTVEVTKCKRQGELVAFTEYDMSERILKQGTYNQDSILIGQYQAWEYDASGQIRKEETHTCCAVPFPDMMPTSFGFYVGNDMFVYGVPDGLSTIKEYFPNGVYTVTELNFKKGIKHGEHVTYSYINGQKQIDTYAYFDDNSYEGKYQEYIGDTVIFCSFKNDVLDGEFKIYLDDALKYRQPKHICTDTTKLILLMKGTYRNDKLNGVRRMYDETGFVLCEENFKDDNYDGWSIYRKVSFCNEYKAYFEENVWQKSQYFNADNERIIITRLNDSKIIADTYRLDGSKKNSYIYNVPADLLEGFNHGAWIDILKAEGTKPTGDFEIYDEENRLLASKRAEDNYILHNDYSQGVTFYASDEEPFIVSYFVINTSDYYTGTFVEDLRNGTSIIYKIKNGYREGVAKVIDNTTKKTIRKIKYSAGVEKK